MTYKYLPEKRFSFVSDAPSLDKDTFGVVQFKGVEGISCPYEFDIMLVSDNPEVNLDEVLEKPAKFTIHRDKGADVDFHGICAEFIQLHNFNNFVFYRAHLVPRLWWLSLTRHNQVCLNKTLPRIIEFALKDGGLTSLDYEMKLQKTYLPKDYVCQYNESHFNFISRWAEREGLYYYFNQNGPAEKIIFTDTFIAHTDFPITAEVRYAPPSGLIEQQSTEFISSFTCHQRQMPRSIYMKDYNYERPSMPVEGRAEVDDKGRGVDYRYGENFSTSEEGNHLARIQAQAISCRKREYAGESTIPFMQPGYTFNLHNHYRNSFNRKYLVESVSHEGDQTGYLIPDILQGLHGFKTSVFYRNNFTAIEADVQYRPVRHAMTPRISGSIHAVIDAEGSGDYAEIDSQGRYKVRLPFDISDDHQAGKASCYLRMVQPHAGSNYGIHFPLHKGVEVLLTFIDGDPDRPVIAGAIGNPETISPVTSKNQTESVIRDRYGNELVFDSTPGDEHIRLFSPHHKSGLMLGRSGFSSSDSDLSEFTAGNKLESCIGSKTELLLGSSLEAKFGLLWQTEFANSFGIFAGGRFNLNYDYEIINTKGPIISNTQKDILAKSELDHVITAGDQVCIVGGANPQGQFGGGVWQSLKGLGINNILGQFNPFRKDFWRPVQPPAVQRNNRTGHNTSIINVFPEKILLTTGNGQINKVTGVQNHRDTTNPCQGNILFDKTPQTQQVVGVLASSVSASILSIITAEIGASVSKDQKGLHTFTALFSALTLMYAWSAGARSIQMLKEELKDEKIEPVTHDRPDAKLEITPGTGADKGIVLETKDRHDPDKETAQIIMKYDGKIEIASRGTEANNNAKEILLIAKGKDNSEKAKISLRNGGIELKSGTCEIHMKQDGDLSIITTGAKNINIKSDNDVNIQSGRATFALRKNGGNIDCPIVLNAALKVT